LCLSDSFGESVAFRNFFKVIFHYCRFVLYCIQEDQYRIYCFGV
jgi:hypothetical protein